MKWTRWSYPALFSVFPLFALAARNPGWYTLRSVFLIAAIVIAVTIAIQALVTLILRARYTWNSAADRAAFVTFVLVVLFYGVEPFPLGPIKSWLHAHAAAAAVGLTALLGFAAFAASRGWHRRVPGLPAVGNYLTLVGALVCAWTLAHTLYYPIRREIALRRSPFVQALARPIPIRAGAARLPHRDVFVIVLDEYAANSVLRDRFNFDNTPFEDSLRALGFRIPAGLRSNYANTLMSVGSLVNFDQTAQIAPTAGIGSHDYGPAAHLIEDNRVARFLRSQEGYRYVFFPSTWYSPTRHSDVADVEFYPYTSFRLARRLYRSAFVLDFVRSTLLRRVIPRMGRLNVVYRDHAVRTFDGVAALEPTRTPTFAFVHVLMPHTPTVVDAACRPAVVKQNDPASEAGEITCLNRLVLRTVRTLIARSRVPPIIILQGDHGTASLKIFWQPDAVPTQAQARERFQPFGAYYLPDGGGAAMPDPTSIVNVMRYVLSYYYGAELPPLPNTMYYSHWRSPYRLVRINADFTPAGALPGVRLSTASARDQRESEDGSPSD